MSEDGHRDARLGEFADADAGTEDAGDAEGAGNGDADARDAHRPARADWEPDLADLEESVALGVELLAHVEGDLSVAAAVDRIETITTSPERTRRVLDAAERRGAITRADGVVRTRRGVFLSHEASVERREGDYECRRCGAGIGTGHFVQFETGELGPFGSSCVRVVTGRDRGD